MSIVILRPHLTVRTARLSIRPLAPDDHAAWRAAHLAQPPPDSLYDSGPRPEAELTRGVFRSLLQRNARLVRQDIFYQLAVFDQAEATLLGIVSLQVVARVVVQLAWIGWRVFGQHRRNGYAGEAALAVIDLGFRELLLHRVEAGIEPDNRISARLARSLGMRKESSEKHSAFLRHDWADLDVHAIHSEDRGFQSIPTFGLAIGDERQVVPMHGRTLPIGK